MDRSHRRMHVQRQDRRIDPTDTTRPDRTPGGGNLQAEIDSRYSPDHIVSHSDAKLLSTVVDSSADILRLAGNAQVVGIDEGQFFDMGIVDAAETLANRGKRVIIAGLDQDYRGKPFEPCRSSLPLPSISPRPWRSASSAASCRSDTADNRSNERVLVGARTRTRPDAAAVLSHRQPEPRRYRP